MKTSLAETLCRDRFVCRTRRALPLAAVLVRAHARIATQSGQKLQLLDSRDSGCVDVGAPTDTVRARHVGSGQAQGRSLNQEYRDADGVLYVSRLTGDDCVALFDRAVHKLTVLDACALKDHPELPAVLEQDGIHLTKE